MIRNRSRSRSGAAQWYKSASYLLNNVAPTLVHDYMLGRYYDSVGGSQGFPFPNIRTTNATQYDSSGRMVWAPANMIAQSTPSGAVLGVLGSGGAVPTGWQVSGVAGLSHTIVEIGTDYIDIRISGTNTSGSIGYPHIYLMALTPAVFGQSYTYSASTQIVGGSSAGFSAFGRLTIQFFNVAVYLNETTNSNAPTATLTRVTSVGAPTNVATTNYRPNISFSVPISASVDITIRISNPQMEYTDINSPNPYNRTTGSAYYGPRFDYNPANLVFAGLLCEGQVSNLILNSHKYETGWTLTNTTLSTLTLDPMGTTLGRTMLDGVVAATGLSNPVVATTASTQYTASVHLKRGNTDWVRLRVTETTDANGFQCWFNTNTGALGTAQLVGTGTFTALSAQVMPINNGWYRVSISGTVGAATTMAMRTMTASADLSATNVNGGTYQIFGHQIETFPSFPACTSYVPTFSASATRAAEIVTKNIDTWYNAGSGTLYAEMLRSYDSLSHQQQPYTISDGTLNNRIQIQAVGSIASVHRSAGVNYDFGGATGLAAFGQIQKIAYQYKALGASYIGQGGAQVSSGTAVPPVSPTILRVGGNFAGATGKAWVKEIRVYPSDTASTAQLQALTT